MDSTDEKKGASAPVTPESPAPPAEGAPATPGAPADEHVVTSYQPTVDDQYGYYDDPYGYDPHAAYNQAGGSTTAVTEPPAPPAPVGTGGHKTPPPAPPPDDEEDDDDDGMLRMSFLEHLEELRWRIIKVLGGIAVSFLICISFANQLWNLVSAPAVGALKAIGANPPKLAFNSPMEPFSIIWMKLPLLASLFVVSPWVLYQVWGFISPGLYKKERRFAAPFILCSAGLFIVGGLFAYFVAFRFGLTFLLGIGAQNNIAPVVSITEYFDLFVNVTLGVALVFEMPVLIFFLTLLRIASPKFLLTHSRYAILIITVLAAIVTPTPDVFNLMLFALPMVLLYFIGIFASYLLVLKRENRRFPWRLFAIVVGIPLLLIGAAVVVAVTRYGYHFVPQWPFLVR